MIVETCIFISIYNSYVHRKAVVLTDEQRYLKLLAVVQNNVRNFVPLLEMRKLCQSKASSNTGQNNYNFLSLYHMVCMFFIFIYHVLRIIHSDFILV